MAYLKKLPTSPNWIAVLTRSDGSRTCKSTKIRATVRNRSDAQDLCTKWQRAMDGAGAVEPIKNRDAVVGVLLEAIHKTQDGSFTDATARVTLNRILEAIGQTPMRLTTTEEFLRDWIGSKAVTKAAGTAVRYRHTIESFLGFLGKRAAANIASLTPRDFEGFRDLQIREGKSPATANLAIKTLRIPMNLARRQGLLLTNPAEAVDLLQSESGIRSTFSREQVRDLLAVADVEWRGMILFGVCHGLRIGDAARLQWANIDADRGTLRFFPAKTSRGKRRIPEEYPLHPDVADYLASIPARDDPKAPIFRTLSGKPVSGAGGLSEVFRKHVMRRAGIIAEAEGEARKRGKGRRFFELGFHSLRHTAVSEMANRGVSKEVRMKLSGHKSNVHERYTHHELEVLRRAVEAVPSFT